MKNQIVLLLSQPSSEASNLKLVLEFVGKAPILINEPELDAHRDNPKSIACIILSIKSYLLEIDRILAYLQQHFAKTPIILLKDTEYSGAAEYLYDCISLPYTQAQLLQIMQRCELQHQAVVTAPNSVTLREMSELIVGDSLKIKKLRELITQVATSDVNVLILGESGTGKEVVAKCIHTWSRRYSQRFVPVNCGAIPSELLESELFGHEKGSFTGALTARQGRFELASGGTIFLDEIGDMPLAMQVKLLRVIQERCFERVGSNKSILADVRVVAATHRNLEQAIASGEFREDLYYRLNVFPIEMPTVRERVEDLPLLIADIVNRCGRQQRCSLNFTNDALAMLQGYSWPGNIRELGNLVERLMVLYPNETIDDTKLPPKYRTMVSSTEVSLETQPSFLPGTPEWFNKVDLKQYLMHTEMTFIKQALEHSSGIVSQAARYLNIRRTTLIEKMRKYGLSRDEFESHHEERV